jgi:mono/diheme cytochrome c family protein
MGRFVRAGARRLLATPRIDACFAVRPLGTPLEPAIRSAPGWRGRFSVLQRKARAAFLFVAGLGLALACSDSQQPAAQPAAPVSPEPAPAAAPAADSASAQAEAEKIFSERCVTCHGAQGAGDGPASAGLVPKPRDFTDPAWQRSVEDGYIEQIVQYGGAAVGKSAAMPANPDLMSKPAVVAALRAHVRALSK